MQLLHLSASLAAAHVVSTALGAPRMTNQTDPDDEDSVASLWKWAIRTIGLFASVLGVLFAWVQLRAIPLPALENTDPTYIRRIVLALYYACWVAGTTIDANIQKEVYRNDPERGNVSREAVIAVAGLFVVAAFLLWASTSDERISVALVPFLIVNIIAWRVLVHRVHPIITATALKYEKQGKFHRLEQLHVVRGYIAGWWQWARFALMGLIVIAANVFTFSASARSFASRTLQDFLPPNTAAAVPTLLPVAALCLFVIAAETWIWVLRARNAIALRTIGALARRYTLKPR
jgi:hypothetical protein